MFEEEEEDEIVSHKKLAKLTNRPKGISEHSTADERKSFVKCLKN